MSSVPARTQNADVAQETALGSSTVVLPIAAAAVCSVHFAPFHVSMMMGGTELPNVPELPSSTPSATQYLVVAQDTLKSATSVAPLGSGTAGVGFSEVPL